MEGEGKGGRVGNVGSLRHMLEKREVEDDGRGMIQRITMHTLYIYKNSGR